MAIPTTALIGNERHQEVRQMIMTRLQRGKDYWRPLHMRQDYWSMLYKMEDLMQLIKPVGYRRFISNEPHTAVDLAQSILTRNDAFWRIALFEEGAENRDERAFLGKVERVLQGMVYDMDEMFSMRLKPRMWKQAAAQALLRGMIWGKAQITTDALQYRDTPMVAEMYDPRLVYPHVDGWGLSYVIIESMTTLGDLVNSYPSTFGEREHDRDYDPNRQATKIEYWSNDRGDRKGICAVMAMEMPVEQILVYDLSPGGNGQRSPEFVIPPYFHGYSPDALPVVGVAVNGLNLLSQPQLGQLVTDRLAERRELLGGAPTSYGWWTGQNAHVADIGRSLLASVEEHVPQYNELIATIMQHFAISAYGTWVFTSPTGEQPRFTPGIEAKIALTPDEKLERMQVGAINADAYRLVDILGAEKQNGMLANILRASSPQAANGVLFQQMANAALNALEPFQDGMEEFGQRLGTSLLAQMKEASPILKPFEVIGPKSATTTKRQAYWVVEFDPKELKKHKRKLRPRPVFKPALPDDLAVRINAARLALDPRRPILSLTTVLEHILQVEDPTDEIDRIWEDIANTDPVLVFEQIGQALERLGEHELATRIQEKQFRTAFLEELAFRQQAGTAIPQPGAMPGQPGGGEPGNMPPEAGAGEFNTQTTESMGGGGMGGAAGGGAMGAMGERATV
jgi:hypothetical protein